MNRPLVYRFNYTAVRPRLVPAVVALEGTGITTEITTTEPGRFGDFSAGAVTGSGCADTPSQAFGPASTTSNERG